MCSLLCGWNAAVPDVCDAEVSDLALEAVSGLSSAYQLLGHISRIKPGQGVVCRGWGGVTGFWSWFGEMWLCCNRTCMWR